MGGGPAPRLNTGELFLSRTAVGAALLLLLTVAASTPWAQSREALPVTPVGPARDQAVPATPVAVKRPATPAGKTPEQETGAPAQPSWAKAPRRWQRTIPDSTGEKLPPAQVTPPDMTFTGPAPEPQPKAGLEPPPPKPKPKPVRQPAAASAPADIAPADEDLASREAPPEALAPDLVTEPVAAPDIEDPDEAEALPLLLPAEPEAPLGPPWPGVEWDRSGPDEEGLDGALLDDLVARLRANEFPDLHSLLVVRNGYLVTEAYFQGRDAEAVHRLKSVTKSVVATLIGIGLQQDMIESLKPPVLNFFSAYVLSGTVSLEKRSLNLRSLLTMRAGMNWNERRDNGWLNRGEGDWYGYILGRSMRRMPGESFRFNSGAAVLLGGVVKSFSGLRVDAFAQKYLFEPLGINGEGAWPAFGEADGERDLDWAVGRNGQVHTGGGLHLRSRDMARIGYLYLRGGMWGETRILPRDWVRRATVVRVRAARKFSGYPPFGYGYMWWLLPLDGRGGAGGAGGDPAGIYMAWGAGGQFIFVVPSHDLVVVFTGGASNVGDEIKPVSLLYDFILKAVK